MPEKETKSKLRADHFMVWLTLPKEVRGELGSAAGGLEMSMSEFSRLAVLEALRLVRTGKNPFKAKGKK